MKQLVKNSFLLLALVGLMFSSCKKEYDRPPITMLPIGEVYTIEQILQMESGTVFNEDASVYGIITADEKSGNLYKTAFMQDRASGKAIELYMNATSGVRIGDSIRVYLKDVTYAMYNGLPQLSNFEADGHIVILANDKPIPPAEATIADIKAGKYLGGLVKLKNVMFPDQGTFADPTGYGNRTLVDPNDLSQSVIVRTSNYANFAKDHLPQGTGNVTAIAAVYNQTWQLYIRSVKELEFEGYNPGESGDDEEGVHTLPYFQSFASSFGSYSTYDVLGDQKWVIDYSTAKMTGFENSNNYANEDWLISAPVSFVGANNVSLTMTYIARYFNDLNNDITIQVSSDYESGNPNEATWKRVNASWTSGSDWNTFAQTTLDLSEFVGDTVRVAVKYLSTAQKAGTIEVQSIALQKGGGDGPTPPPGPGGDVMSMPYSQSFETDFGTYITKDVLGSESWIIDYKTAKMTGYAGSSHANEDWLISSPVSVTGVNEAKVSVNYAAQFQNSNPKDITMQVSTDYVYGQDPGSANWTELSATYPNTANWSDFQTVETSLNGFIGQTVTVAVKYTSTDAQSRTIEIKNITVQEGHADGGDTPPTPPPGPAGELQNMPYVQSFASEFGTYLTKDVLGPQSWTIKYESAWISGHEGGSSGADYDNEDWLISSPVKIEGVQNAKAVLNYAAKYNAPVEGDVTMLVSTNYEWDSDPGRADWTVVMPDIENNSSGNTWTFTDKEASLDNFIGQTVTVAVKFLSTANGSRTFEIKSISVMEGSAGGDTPPTPPPTPGDPEGSGTAEDPYNVAAGIAQQSGEPVAWVQGYIVGAVRNGTSSVSSNSDVIWSGSFDSATNVVLADDPDCHEISQCLFVNLPSGKPLRAEVNLMDNPGNLGKKLSVLGKLRKYFNQPGLRDSNGQYEDFVLEGSEPPTPVGTVYLNETLLSENSFGTFSTYNGEGAQEWYHSSSYGAVMSGYQDGTSYANEDWLISPELDLSNSTNPVLVFDHARGPESSMNVGVAEGYYTVWVIGDYAVGENPVQYPNAQIVGVIHPTVKWQYVSSGELPIPLNLRDSKVRIAFKYISADGASATWEIKNVIVKEKE